VIVIFCTWETRERFEISGSGERMKKKEKDGMTVGRIRVTSGNFDDETSNTFIVENF